MQSIFFHQRLKSPSGTLKVRTADLHLICRLATIRGAQLCVKGANVVENTGELKVEVTDVCLPSVDVRPDALNADGTFKDHQTVVKAEDLRIITLQ